MNILVWAVLLISADGWYTWQVDAAEGLSFGNGVCECSLTDEVRIYALVEAGKAVEIRLQNADCPVESENDVTDLGLVETNDSIDWLVSQIGADQDVTSDSLLAISVHDAERAVGELVGVLEDRKLRMNVREEALFWMVHSGSDDAFDYLDKLLSGDR